MTTLLLQNGNGLLTQAGGDFTLEGTPDILSKLICHGRFDSALIETADASGHGNNIFWDSQPTLQVGQIAGANSLAGNGFIVSELASSITDPNVWSMAFWIKFTHPTNDFLEFTNGGFDIDIVWSANRSGSSTFIVAGEAGGLAVDSLPNDFSWHHVVVTKSADSIGTLYIDGVFKGEQAVFDAENFWDNPDTSAHINYNNAAAWIDDFLFYNRCLTAGDATALAASASGPIADDIEADDSISNSGINQYDLGLYNS